MSLVISIRENADFYIKDTRYTVKSISASSFMIQRSGGNHDVWVIDDTKMQEIFPFVRVSCGRPPQINTNGVLEASLVFDAPRNILILRGDLYRKPK